MYPCNLKQIQQIENCQDPRYNTNTTTHLLRNKFLFPPCVFPDIERQLLVVVVVVVGVSSCILTESFSHFPSYFCNLRVQSKTIESIVTLSERYVE